MMRVALSGGIASGKTLASDAFARLGVPIVDTDIIARDVVAPGTDGLQKIARRFGKSVLDPQGALDRKKLRGIVFSDDAARADLESIVHPQIRELCAQKLKTLEHQNNAYAVVVIPLLVETQQHNSYDHVIIVDVEPGIQIERVMTRDNCSLEQAQSILNSQASRQARLAVANDVIINNSTKHEVDNQVEKLHEQLLLTAAQRLKSAD